MRKKLTYILENYIETIYSLEQKNKKQKGVRITDIAKLTERSKASVNTAIKSLLKDEYIVHEHYGDIILTEKGLAVAKELSKKHTIIYHFLTSVLKIEPDVADKEACKIEHSMSKETASKFKKYLCRHCKVCSKCVNQLENL